MTGEDRAIAALGEILDELGISAHVASITARRSERNRLTLLHLHAAAAVLVGPLFALLGRDGMSTSSWVVARHIPGAPLSLGITMTVGGVILGVSTWRRALNWEIAGLWILALWYLTICLSFTGAIMVWSGHPVGGVAKPSFYAPIVYAHLTAIMAIHLRTLTQKQRARKRGIP